MGFVIGLLCAGLGAALTLWGGRREKGFAQWAGLVVFTAGLIYAYAAVAHMGHPLQAAMRDCPPCF